MPLHLQKALASPTCHHSKERCYKQHCTYSPFPSAVALGGIPNSEIIRLKSTAYLWSCMGWGSFLLSPQAGCVSPRSDSGYVPTSFGGSNRHPIGVLNRQLGLGGVGVDELWEWGVRPGACSVIRCLLPEGRSLVLCPQPFLQSQIREQIPL